MRSTFTRVDQNMAATVARLVPRNDEAYARELRSRFRQLPGQLRTSGLAATYAFLAARSRAAGGDKLQEAYRNVAETIRTRLSERRLIEPETLSAGEIQQHHNVLEVLGSLDPLDYARATREVATLFMWMRRLSDSVTPEESGSQEATSE